MGAFEFSSQKWRDYYDHCDLLKEEKRREENRFFRRLHPLDFGKISPMYRSWIGNPVFANLCMKLFLL